MKLAAWMILDTNFRRDGFESSLPSMFCGGSPRRVSAPATRVISLGGIRIPTSNLRSLRSVSLVGMGFVEGRPDEDELPLSMSRHEAGSHCDGRRTERSDGGFGV